MIGEVFLRISVSPICNLRCKYCPPTMEDRTPRKQDSLSTKQVVEFLEYASHFGVNGISLTGGEPWLRADLIDLTKKIKSIKSITKLEITTNGTANRPEDVQQLVEAGITHAKVSMDALDPLNYAKMTGRALQSKVLENLAAYKSTGVPTSINTVLTKSTLQEVPSLVQFAVEHGYHLSILDLVYDSARHDFWISEFCPTSVVEETIRQVTDQDGQIYERFGCRTIEYVVGGVAIHVKDSTTTMRTERCQRCSQYCQEGLFALRLSSGGWLTTCPNATAENGIYVAENEEGLRTFLPAMASEFASAVCTHSFERFAKLL